MITFLVNANSKIGAGHFLRCLNIGLELANRGHDINFTSWSLEPKFKKILERHQFKFTSLESLSAFDATSYLKLGSFLVIDSDDIRIYEREFQFNLLHKQVKFMIITVNDNYEYFANILLNQSALALNQSYKTAEHTKTLLGPSYFIFNKKFRNQKKGQVKHPGKEVFIGFGASDPMDYTSKVLERISKSNQAMGLNFHVVIGGLNRRHEDIKQLVASNGIAANLYYDINNIEEVYKKCNVAICSPGSMYWELTLFGIQSYLFSSSRREIDSASYLNDSGYAKLIHQYGTKISNDKLDHFISLVSKQVTTAENFKDLQNMISPNGVDLICNEIQSELLSHGKH